MKEEVIKLICDYLFNNRHIVVKQDDIFIVWSCYILGNRKYLVGLTDYDTYFEVTFDNNKKQWYIDEYNKVNNICVKH